MESSEWKKIQQRTFTRYVNHHLQKAGTSIHSLETDLADGLKLIVLVSVLSGKNISRFNKKPTFRTQKLENVSIALTFLETEGVTLVNIDSSDITDSRLKLIMSLIWALILHYSSVGIKETEKNKTMTIKKLEDVEIDVKKEDVRETKQPQTPKQKLIGWLQHNLRGIPLGNLTTDWRDGKKIGALVNGVAPGLCPDWEDWNPEEPVRNAAEAMDLADNWLGVSQLISPEDMVSPHLDEMSMITYLSQYPKAVLKENAPIREQSSKPDSSLKSNAGNIRLESSQENTRGNKPDEKCYSIGSIKLLQEGTYDHVNSAEKTCENESDKKHNSTGTIKMSLEECKIVDEPNTVHRNLPDWNANEPDENCNSLGTGNIIQQEHQILGVQNIENLSQEPKNVTDGKLNSVGTNKSEQDELRMLDKIKEQLELTEMSNEIESDEKVDSAVLNNVIQEEEKRDGNNLNSTGTMMENEPNENAAVRGNVKMIKEDQNNELLNLAEMRNQNEPNVVINSDRANSIIQEEDTMDNEQINSTETIIENEPDENVTVKIIEEQTIIEERNNELLDLTEIKNENEADEFNSAGSNNIIEEEKMDNENPNITQMMSDNEPDENLNARGTVEIIKEEQTIKEEQNKCFNLAETRNENEPNEMFDSARTNNKVEEKIVNGDHVNIGLTETVNDNEAVENIHSRGDIQSTEEEHQTQAGLSNKTKPNEMLNSAGTNNFLEEDDKILYEDIPEKLTFIETMNENEPEETFSYNGRIKINQEEHKIVNDQKNMNDNVIKEEMCIKFNQKGSKENKVQSSHKPTEINNINNRENVSNINNKDHEHLNGEHIDDKKYVCNKRELNENWMILYDLIEEYIAEKLKIFKFDQSMACGRSFYMLNIAEVVSGNMFIGVQR